VGGHVVALVRAMVDGVSDEDAGHRTRTELVSVGHRGVRVAEAVEGADLIIAWWSVEKQVMQCDGPRRAIRTPVDQAFSTKR
jgi:hypothetical protein